MLEATKNTPFVNEPKRYMPDEASFKTSLRRRTLAAKVFGGVFFSASIFALVVLVFLFGSVVNTIAGYAALSYQVPLSELSTRPIEELSSTELGAILTQRVQRDRMRVLVLENTLGEAFTTDRAQRPRLGRETVGQLLASYQVPEAVQDKKLGELSIEELVSVLQANISQTRLANIIISEVAVPQYLRTWGLLESLLDRGKVEREMTEDPRLVGQELVWRNWLTGTFITGELTADPATAGVRPALVGSLWIILLTVLLALPLGVGAAIYLEEYAPRNRLTNLIETNIRNLSGVPSIIYGMLGLAIFVRALGYFTSGNAFGTDTSNGRTIISAAMTMALLIMPVVIINAQEALRAVPASIREASYGVGATKWQTIWRQVLPAGLPGILTGVILSMSRAVGETAPLLVVGGLAFMTADPSGPFSKFSVVPIQIFNWTAEPEQAFRNIAASAIVVLLGVLLALNATAIIIRQRFSKKLRG
jgi:phosphate transport system permease protein